MSAWWDSQPAWTVLLPLLLECVHQGRPRSLPCSPFGAGFEDLKALSQQKWFSKVTSRALSRRELRGFIMEKEQSPPTCLRGTPGAEGQRERG